jgi:hypothetical protein
VFFPHAITHLAPSRRRKLGWTEGRNILIDTRWATADVESMQRFARELVALPATKATREAAMAAFAKCWPKD